MPKSSSVAAIFTLLLLVGFSSGCVSDGVTPTAPATPTTTASVGEAYRDAEAVANREPGRVTARGMGDSMAPVYGDNTLLVINPIRFEELQPGMTVAYINGRGMRVVHKLVSRSKGGWFVIGINNTRIDEDLVTADNLLGVVYASFHYTDES